MCANDNEVKCFMNYVIYVHDVCMYVCMRACVCVCVRVCVCFVHGDDGLLRAFQVIAFNYYEDKGKSSFSHDHLWPTNFASKLASRASPW